MTDKKLYGLYGEYLKLFSEKIDSGEFDSSYNPMNFREWETQIREDPDSMVEFYNGDVPKFVDYEDKFEKVQTVDNGYEAVYEKDLETFLLSAKNDNAYNLACCTIAQSIGNILSKDIAKAHILLSNVKDIKNEGNVLSIKVKGQTYIIEVR
jgi:hypothetical protein